MKNLEDIDFTKKENQTFENWFEVMWQNNFMTVFIVGIIMLIYILYWTWNLGGEKFLLLIPVYILSVTGYMGFYKKWKELKTPNKPKK